MPINVLFIGAHPDDVEWGVGGIALLLKQRNVSFAIVDLTRGELGSRGTVEERTVEAKQAAEFMGTKSRENLNRSQFGQTAGQQGVIPQGLGDYLYTLETRDRHYGSQIGAHYGEALITDRPLRLHALEELR